MYVDRHHVLPLSGKCCKLTHQSALSSRRRCADERNERFLEQALAITARLIALMQNLTEILDREAQHVHSLGRDRLRGLRLPVPGGIARIAEAIECFGADRHGRAVLKGRLLRWR